MGTVIRQTLGLGLLCFVFVYNQIFFQCLLPKKSRTQSFCYASIFWSVCLFIITEGLSLFNAVNGKMLFASWSVVIFTEILISIKQKYRIQNVVVQSFQDIKRYWSSLETISKALFVTIIISTIITGILAVITVPNNWDSMTYHLSRIAFWQEHGNVNYYATNIPRQLFSPVFAEYINLHVMSICRGDLYVNLLQTISGIGVLVLVYSSARALNISRKLRLFAVVLVQGMNIFIAIVFGGMPISGGARSKIYAALIGGFSYILLNDILEIVIDSSAAYGITQVISAVFFMAVVYVTSMNYRTSLLPR